MAWWSFLETESIKTTSGVFLWAGALAVGMLLGGLGLAYAWHWWKTRAKARARAAASKKA